MAKFNHKIVAGLSKKEFRELLQIIEKDHWLIQGRGVKYVDLSYDLRTKEIWKVNLRCFGPGKEFMTCNRDQSAPDSLYIEIFNWLEDGRELKK